MLSSKNIAKSLRGFARLGGDYYRAQTMYEAATTIEKQSDEIAALCAEVEQYRADIEAGRLVRLPDTLITPYELNERYWVCGWNSERCTMTIQDRKMLVEEAARAALEKEDAREQDPRNP